MKQRIRRYYEGGFKRSTGVRTVEESLFALAALGFAPETTIDIGAYDGEWARECRRAFPSTGILLLEAQPAKLPRLQQTAADIGNAEVRCTLLGAEAKEGVPFFVDATASSVLRDAEGHAKSPTYLPMVTLDSVVHGTRFDAPQLIKLDVQGYELEVLRGASATVAAAQVVLMEVNFIEVYAGAPLIAETTQFMAQRGYRLYDIATIVRRPLDGALFQVDAVFVHEDSPLLSSKRWS